MSIKYSEGNIEETFSAIDKSSSTSRTLENKTDTEESTGDVYPEKGYVPIILVSSTFFFFAVVLPLMCYIRKKVRTFKERQRRPEQRQRRPEQRHAGSSITVNTCVDVISHMMIPLPDEYQSIELPEKQQQQIPVSLSYEEKQTPKQDNYLSQKDLRKENSDSSIVPHFVISGDEEDKTFTDSSTNDRLTWQDVELIDTFEINRSLAASNESNASNQARQLNQQQKLFKEEMKDDQSSAEVKDVLPESQKVSDSLVTTKSYADNNSDKEDEPMREPSFSKSPPQSRTHNEKTVEDSIALCKDTSTTGLATISENGGVDVSALTTREAAMKSRTLPTRFDSSTNPFWSGVEYHLKSGKEHSAASTSAVSSVSSGTSNLDNILSRNSVVSDW